MTIISLVSFVSPSTFETFCSAQVQKMRWRVEPEEVRLPEKPRLCCCITEQVRGLHYLFAVVVFLYGAADCYLVLRIILGPIRVNTISMKLTLMPRVYDLPRGLQTTCKRLDDGRSNKDGRIWYQVHLCAVPAANRVVRSRLILIGSPLTRSHLSQLLSTPRDARSFGTHREQH